MSTDEVSLPTGTYTIDPGRSVILLRAKHAFGTGTMKATFDLDHGMLIVADPPRNSSASATVHVGTFASDKTRRVEHVLSASLLDVASYPEMTFVSRQLRLEGDWVLAGDLTAHGVTRPVELRVVSAESIPGGVHARATTRIDRYEFGVTKVKGMAGRWMEIEADVVATAQPTD